MTARSAGAFLAVLSVFLYGYTLPGVTLNLFFGVLVLMAAAGMTALAGGTPSVQKPVVLALLVVLTVGAVGVLLGRGPIASYLLQVLAISLVTVSATVVIAGSGVDSVKLFPTYLELSFYFALIALSELVLGAFGLYLPFLTPEVDYVFLNFHRVSGLAAEPAHYCFVMAPSVVAVLISLLSGRPCMSVGKSLAIVASYILTFSSVGFFLLALVLVVFLFRRSSLSSFAAKVVLAMGVVGIFAVIPQINMRILDTYAVFVTRDDTDVNLSSLTLYKNSLVSLNSAIEQPLFGAGLGGHERNYLKYLPEALANQGRNLNEKDANSMFLRLISELGLPFTAAFYLLAILLWTGFPDRMDSEPVFWKKLTSTAILGMIIVTGLRGGNYIAHGFPFFLVLYYDVYRRLKFGDVPLSAVTPRLLPARFQ